MALRRPRRPSPVAVNRRQAVSLALPTSLRAGGAGCRGRAETVDRSGDFDRRIKEALAPEPGRR